MADTAIRLSASNATPTTANVSALLEELHDVHQLLDELGMTSRGQWAGDRLRQGWVGTEATEDGTVVATLIGTGT